ncbi:MAG: Uma2 family endonuclease [Planctomycetes bacterium]|nr:Uma2 family endonuclease [Planctomycetota bacterium]
MSELGTRRWTYDEYCRLPDDGKRYEVLDGELCMAPAPTTRHQEQVGNLHLILGGYARATGRGSVFVSPIDVVLSPHHVLQPDLIFIAAERSAIIGDACITGPPDIVVEILSESTRRRDLVVKKEFYARFGVREYWIVDPAERRIRRLVLEGGTFAARGEAGAASSSDLLPDLSIAVDEILG